MRAMEHATGEPRARVLVADDDPLMRRLLRTFLGTRDDLHLVGEAPDGRAALALAATLEPDVVVLDQGMPGLDGLGAAQAIRAAVPACRIVMFSGHDDAEALEDARAAGADRYVEKHGGLDGLADAVLAVRATPRAA
jgi:two-component system response regulator DesR